MTNQKELIPMLPGDLLRYRREQLGLTLEQASARCRIKLSTLAAIESGEGDVPRAKPWRLKVLLPEDAGPSTEYLASCFQEVGAEGNATVECVFARKMEPSALASKLRACIGQGIDVRTLGTAHDES